MQSLRAPLLGLCVIAIFYGLSRLPFATRLENHVYDRFMRATADVSKWPDDVVVLAIDEKSLREVGDFLGKTWPWPRWVHAALIAELKRAGARAVLLDVLFAEERDPFDDDVLATYIEACGNVWLVDKLNPKSPNGLSLIDPFRNAAGSKIGLADMDSVKDRDGVIRRYPTAQSNPVNPSQKTLPLSTAFLHSTGRQDVEREIYLKFHFRSDNPKIFHSVSDLLIPAFKEWKSGNDHVELDQVKMRIASLSQRSWDEKIRNKIVFVGATAIATYDSVATPMTGHDAGVMIHATALENWMNGNYLKRVPEGIYLPFFLMMGVFICLPSLFVRSAPGQVLCLLALMGGILGASFLGFVNSWWIPPLMPILGLTGAHSVMTTYNYFVEGRQRRFMTQLFSDFVSPDVLAEIQSTGGLNLRGESRVGTVLFCDLAGFTTFTETATPEQLIDGINTYLAEASKVILSYNGYVDKFIGDAVMAIFNIPRPQENHELVACYAALDLKTMMKELNENLGKKYGVSLSLRTGINTGKMIAGPMGYARKLNYSALGDSVNLASRLEGANKEYGTSIMIGSETYEQVKDQVETRLLDYLRVKGKNLPVKVYELIGRKGSLTEEEQKLYEEYSRGVEAYLKREWVEALNHLHTAITIRPDDKPSQIFLKRCQQFQKDPPADDWDGSFGLDTK
jgi:adenylate cyclase